MKNSNPSSFTLIYNEMEEEIELDKRMKIWEKAQMDRLNIEEKTDLLEWICGD